jgi:hypothetical protein
VEEVWLHFDAKYRVDYLHQLFGQPEETELEDEDGAAARTRSKRDDLMKMHAYKDAIGRSAGSYVLYPGSDPVEPERFDRYHEILPGLGAFALRPTENGPAEGSPPLVEFIDDTLTHFASVLTQYRRGRYWEDESYSPSTRTDTEVGWEAPVAQPPADTIVLLGYVKNTAHLKWIQRELLYNLRAGDRRGSVGLTGKELAARIVALYGPDLSEPELWFVGGEPEVWTRARLESSGYPRPGGDLYLCLRLTERIVPLGSSALTLRNLVAIRARLAPRAGRGAPIATTWLDLFGRPPI